MIFIEIITILVVIGIGGFIFYLSFINEISKLSDYIFDGLKKSAQEKNIAYIAYYIILGLIIILMIPILGFLLVVISRW